MAGECKTGEVAAVPRWLIGAGATTLCAALLIPFGALPPFDTGYYGLVSASIQWLHFCAGSGGLLLAVGLLVAKTAVASRLFNPVSLTIAAFAGITAIPALYADHTGLVVLGSPQSGKGVLWFCDLAIFVALGWLIRDSRMAMGAVFLTAVTTTAGITALRVYVHLSETELLLPGGDSYAFLGLLLPFVTILLRDSRLHGLYVGVAWLVAGACIATSGNKAAIAIFCILAPLYGLAFVFPAPFVLLSRLRFSGIFAGITVSALALAYIVVSIDFRGSFDSIDSRLLIAKIATAAQLQASPLQWAAGHGWGHTQDAFYRGLIDSGASLLDNRWDFLWRDIFHSHNLVLELVYETGLLGFTAFCALLAGLVASASSRNRNAALFFAAGYLIMNSVWFEFAHTVPMLALAVFALAHPDPVLTRPPHPYGSIGFGTVMFIALACFGASSVLHVHDQRVKPYKMKDAVLARPDFPASDFPQDPRGDDFIRAATYREIVRSITVLHQTTYDAIAPAKAISAILQDIERRLSETRDPELLLVGLVIFNDAHFNQRRGWLKPIVAGREALWGRLAARHLTLAPKRTDALVVYLSWLVTNNRAPQARELVETIMRNNPADPVALYFEGVLDTNDSAQSIKQRGLRRIGRAVDLGVERFLIVPDWLKELASKANAK